MVTVLLFDAVLGDHQRNSGAGYRDLRHHDVRLVETHKARRQSLVDHGRFHFTNRHRDRVAHGAKGRCRLPGAHLRVSFAQTGGEDLNDISGADWIFRRHQLKRSTQDGRVIASSENARLRGSNQVVLGCSQQATDTDGHRNTIADAHLERNLRVDLPRAGEIQRGILAANAHTHAGQLPLQR